MGATRIGFSRPAGFDLGMRNSGAHISGPEFETSRPGFQFVLRDLVFRAQQALGLRSSGAHISGPEFEISRPGFRFAP